MSAIEEIKRRINIVDLAVQLGLEPTANDFIYSVYKQEKNRSLKLYRSNNSFYDFSTGKYGDVINLYAAVKNTDNEQAIKMLLKENGIASGYKNNGSGKLVKQKKENFLEQRKKTEIYHEFEKFCNGLGEKTLQYLKGATRGLTDETIKSFRLYEIINVTKTIDHLLSNFEFDNLKAAGLFNENGNFVFSNHRLIIPYIEGENIIYLRGRIIPEQNNGNNGSLNDKLSKYIGLIGQAAKRFYNINSLKDLKEGSEILLCEGEFDTMIAEQNGIKALGIPGVHNFPLDHIKKIEQFDTYICFDNDKAGEEGMKNIAVNFKKEVKGIKLLKHKDITEVFSNVEGNQLLHPEVSEIITLNEITDCLPKLIDANELSNMEIPETNWVIENLIPEGANIFAGKPKEGKTIIGLNVALAVAQGGKLFSYFNAKKNGVLYLSYEDSLARLKKRMNTMKKIDHIDSLPKNLYFPLKPYDFPVLDENGLSIIEGYLEKYKDIKLVIVDTLGRGIDPKVYAKGVTYAGEYGYNSSLHRFAHKNNIAILIIHHTRKAPAENDSDEILGTTGIAGAMDNIYTLKKVNGNYIFHIKGRDVEEKEFRIKRVEESFSWVIEGESKSIELTEEKKEIVELLVDTNQVMQTGQIAKALNKKLSNISKHLKMLHKEGLVFSHGYGKWATYPKDEQHGENGKSSKVVLKQLNFEEPEEILE